MKFLSTLTLSFLLFLLVLQETRAMPSNLEQSSGAASLYDPDPKHIWNRLYDAFFIRNDQGRVTYGTDAL